MQPQARRPSREEAPRKGVSGRGDRAFCFPVLHQRRLQVRSLRVFTYCGSELLGVQLPALQWMHWGWHHCSARRQRIPCGLHRVQRQMALCSNSTQVCTHTALERLHAPPAEGFTQPGIGHHEHPRCEVCDRITYNLACLRCGLRICDRCTYRGSECMCAFMPNKKPRVGSIELVAGVVISFASADDKAVGDQIVDCDP